MPGSDSNRLRRCDPHVKVVCNRALASCDKKPHNKCGTTKNASLIPGCEMNNFPQSLGSSEFGTESREGITIKATAVKDDKEYRVCANFEQLIKAPQGTKKTKSQSSPASTATTDMDTTTRLKVTFATNDNADDDTLEVYIVFDDDVEEERERSRVELAIVLIFHCNYSTSDSHIQ